MSNSRDDIPEERRYEFDGLNALGKTVFLTGIAVRGAAQILDGAIDRVAGVVSETERAFREGRDPNLDDANVLDERVEDRA